MKKDEKSGTWKTVKLSQCRLKISQRLRERAPFIKLEQMQARKGVRGATKASSPMVQQTKKSPSFVQTNVIDLFSDDEKSCTCRESWEEESLSPLPPFHDVEDGDSLAPLRSMFESIFGYDPFSFECNGESDQPYQTFSEKRACITMNSSFGESDEPRMNKRRKISFDQNELSRTGYGYINLPCREGGLDDISIVSDLSLPPTEMDQFQLDEDDLDHFMVTLESSATGDDALFEYLDVLF